MQPNLFENSSSLQSSNQSNKVIQPITQVLEEVIQTNQETKSQNSSPSIKKSLDELFPEQQLEEKNLKKTKEILGALAEECTEEELQDVVAKTQYLCENWLDAFERSIFGERTLQELLHEKGGT